MTTVVSVSGGKDSTALLAFAVVSEAPDLLAVFADTGHEHPETYDYVAYLSDWLVDQGHSPIRTVRADFSGKIARRRAYLERIAAGEAENQRGAVRYTPEAAARAAEAMVATGIPFLDLCVLKGRFPSADVRFCTSELKVIPIYEQAILPALEETGYVESWQGVRADESRARASMAPVVDLGGGVFVVRPILRWRVEDVFEAHSAVGLAPNPLYLGGVSRVGCMPCIMARKDELLAIARRWPEEIDRVEAWEERVKRASKRQAASLFPTCRGRGVGIRAIVGWAQTSRGGKQYDLERLIGPHETGCSSIYGLCE
ncbi:MAG: phosphoadenosine phosphosulfate reductase family protein [Rhodospirillales bacterium]|nr:phosphoadenosine phosphosulfate reductase family protein [Rhodospirillales bacterium]